MPETELGLAHLGDIITPWRIIQTILVLATAWATNWLIQTGLQQLANRASAYRLRILRFVPVLRILVWTLAFWIIIFPVFQPKPEAVTAILGAGAIAAGLALQDTLKNIIGGLTLLFDRPFQVGDKVQIGDDYGEVTSIGLRSVRLLTNDDSMIVVPNSVVTTQALSNGNAGASDFQVVIDVYLTEAADVGRLERLAWEAAVSSPFAFLNKPVAIRISEQLGDRPVTRVRIKAYVIDVRLEMRFHSDVTKRVKAAYQAAGYR